MVNQTEQQMGDKADFFDQVNEYMDAICVDYVAWQSKGLKTGYEVDEKIRDQMAKEFCEGVRFEEGRKYIKVIHGTSVHSFIQKEDDKKFKSGDILKAASWDAPARNFARGNILKGGYQVAWTGA